MCFPGRVVEWPAADSMHHQWLLLAACFWVIFMFMVASKFITLTFKDPDGRCAAGPGANWLEGQLPRGPRTCGSQTLHATEVGEGGGKGRQALPGGPHSRCFLPGCGQHIARGAEGRPPPAPQPGPCSEVPRGPWRGLPSASSQRGTTLLLSVPVCQLVFHIGGT